jgi:hypothetical protein
MRKGEACGNAPGERPLLRHGFILRLLAATNNRQIMYPDLRRAYKLQTLPVPSLHRIAGSLNID